MEIIICAIVVLGVMGTTGIICRSSYKHAKLKAGVDIQKDNSNYLLREAELPLQADEKKLELQGKLENAWNTNRRLREDIKLLQGKSG